jgi:hypothetical protein
LVDIAILVSKSQNVDWFFRQVMQYNLHQNIKCWFFLGSLCNTCGHKIYIHNEEPKIREKDKEWRRKNLRGMKIKRIKYFFRRKEKN